MNSGVRNFANDASLVPGPSSIPTRAIKMEDLRGMVGRDTDAGW
jgi:hypothetical protein